MVAFCRKYQLIGLDMLKNFNIQVAAIVQHTDVTSAYKYEKGIDTTNPPISRQYQLE